MACVCGTWSYHGPAADAVDAALTHLLDHAVKENRIYIS